MIPATTQELTDEEDHTIAKKLTQRPASSHNTASAVQFQTDRKIVLLQHRRSTPMEKEPAIADSLCTSSFTKLYETASQLFLRGLAAFFALGEALACSLAMRFNVSLAGSAGDLE